MALSPSHRWRRQFHAGDDVAMAAGAMAQTEALALIAAMLQSGPSRWLRHHLDTPRYILYGQPLMKYIKEVFK